MEERLFKDTNRRGRLDTVVLDRGKRIERLVLPKHIVVTASAHIGRVSGIFRILSISM